jgi:hypothetical protein
MSQSKSMDSSIPCRYQSLGIALAAYRPDPRIFAEQLKSIQSQTFRNWKCWITLDSPLTPLQGEPTLAPFFEDSRFIWSENAARLGHKKNFEHAMNLAAADPNVDAIGCSDQDDVWYSNKLGRCLAQLEKSGPLSLVHSDMHVLNADGSIGSETAWEIENRGVHNATLETLLIRNVVAGCSMLLDASLVRKFPKIPDEFEFHDHWYAVVASAHGGAHPIYEPLYAYRQHHGNVVGVSPFQGFFFVPKAARSLGQILTKLRKGSQQSTRMSQAALRELSHSTRGLAQQLGAHQGAGIQRGLRLLILALHSRQIDPPLARASLARGLGAIL